MNMRIECNILNCQHANHAKPHRYNFNALAPTPCIFLKHFYFHTDIFFSEKFKMFFFSKNSYI